MLPCERECGKFKTLGIKSSISDNFFTLLPDIEMAQSWHGRYLLTLLYTSPSSSLTRINQATGGKKEGNGKENSRELLSWEMQWEEEKVLKVMSSSFPSHHCSEVMEKSGCRKEPPFPCQDGELPQVLTGSLCLGRSPTVFWCFKTSCLVV